MFDDSEETPMLSEIPNETHSLSSSNGFKRSRQGERDRRRRQELTEYRQQSQMQSQRLDRYLQQSGGSGAAGSFGGAAETERARESACVTPEMLRQRVELERAKTSQKGTPAAEKKWSKSLQSVLDNRQSMEVRTPSGWRDRSPSADVVADV
jgi:hypothetical protein